MFATSHLGETRTLPSIFLRSKKGHKMGSFAQRTDRAAPCRVSPSAPKGIKDFPWYLFFLFATSHLGETRTLPSIFLRSKKGHKMGSFAQRTDRAAPCRVSPSAPNGIKDFPWYLFFFFCNFPPGRDKNATVHLFAQHTSPLSKSKQKIPAQVCRESKNKQMNMAKEKAAGLIKTCRFIGGTTQI